MANIPNFEKQQEAIKKRVAGMEGKGGASMDNMARKAKNDNPEMYEKRQMMHQLVDEAMDMHQKGQMDMEEAVEDIHKSMRAMIGKPHKKAEKERESEHESEHGKET